MKGRGWKEGKRNKSEGEGMEGRKHRGGGGGGGDGGAARVSIRVSFGEFLSSGVYLVRSI